MLVDQTIKSFFERVDKYMPQGSLNVASSHA